MIAHNVIGCSDAERTGAAPLPGELARRVGLVLAVDDEPDSREVVGRTLRRAGFDVRSVASVREALEHAGDPELGAVVTDLWMPGGNGLQLVEQLARRRPEVEVVVFTGHATESTRAAAGELGCFRVVDKPDLGALAGAVSEALGRDRARRLAGEGLLPDRPASGSVLLVDDDRRFLAVTARMLDKRGYRVSWAEGGEEALRVFRAGEFDCAVLDINMPRMDGVALAGAIRGLDGEVALLAVTGEARSEQARAMLAAGAEGLMTKPVPLAALEARVGECVRGTRERRQRAERAEARRRRSTVQKAVSLLRSPRRRAERRKLAMYVMAVVLTLAAGVAAPFGAELVEAAASSAAGFVAGFESRLDRIEGYLRRDEQREVERLGGDEPALWGGRLEPRSSGFGAAHYVAPPTRVSDPAEPNARLTSRWE